MKEGYIMNRLESFCSIIEGRVYTVHAKFQILTESLTLLTAPMVLQSTSDGRSLFDLLRARLGSKVVTLKACTGFLA